MTAPRDHGSPLPSGLGGYRRPRGVGHAPRGFDRSPFGVPRANQSDESSRVNRKTVAPLPLGVLLRAARADRGFSRERLWKVLSIDFDAFLPRHPRNDFKWNSEAVCILFFRDWSGEKRSSVIPFLCAWLFGKRNILDGNGLLLRAENLPTRRAGHLNGGILIEGDTHIAGDDRVDRKIGRPSLPALRSWGFSASLARGPTQKLGRGLVVVRSGASERPGLRRILRSPVHIAGTPITKHCV